MATKASTGWKDVKAKLADFDRAGLMGLVHAYFRASRTPISADAGQRFRRSRTAFQADPGQGCSVIADSGGARE